MATVFPQDDDKNTLLLALGERVRALRALRGMTRKTLAAGAQVSERHLANLESGQGNASVLILDQVAKALDCSLAQLLGDETTISPEWLLLRELLLHKSEAQLKQARSALQALFEGAQLGAKLHVSLIGLRGAGKSSIGVRLAAAMGYGFVELNAVIEKLAGCKVLEIHALYGSNAYRRYERRALEETLSQPTPCVVATPGGLVSDASSFSLLLGRSTTVWLQATPEEHMARVLAQGDKRPMLGNREAMMDLRRILKEREAFYVKADVVFSTSDKDLEGCVAQLQLALRNG